MVIISSRSLSYVIKKTSTQSLEMFFSFPEPLSAALRFNICLKMPIVGLESLSNYDLRKRVASLISLEDWSDECGKCG